MYNIIAFFFFGCHMLKSHFKWMHGLYIVLNFISLSGKKYREKSNVFSIWHDLEDFFFWNKCSSPPSFFLCFLLFCRSVMILNNDKICRILQKLIWNFYDFFIGSSFHVLWHGRNFWGHHCWLKNSIGFFKKKPNKKQNKKTHHKTEKNSEPLMCHIFFLNRWSHKKLNPSMSK